MRWTQNSPATGSRFQQTEEWDHINSDLGESISRILCTRQPIDAEQLIANQRLSKSQEMSNRILLRGGLFVFWVSERAPAIIQSNHTRRDIRKWFVKCLSKGYVIRRRAGSVRLSAQASFDRFPCKFRRPLEDVARAIEFRGHKSNHVAQLAFSFSRLAPIGGVSVRDQRRGHAMNLSSPGPRSAVKITTCRVFGVRCACIFPNRRVLPFPRCLDQIINSMNFAVS